MTGDYSELDRLLRGYQEAALNLSALTAQSVEIGRRCSQAKHELERWDEELGKHMEAIKASVRLIAK